VTVNLLDDQENLVASTFTDDDGQYLFTGHAAGDYIVEFILPDDYVFTQQDVGADDTIDSDADRVTGRTGLITLADSDVVTSIDAGMMPAFEIVDEHLFHNDSYYDGNGTAVDGDDSQAIDERVQMLQPGQISTSVNYSTSLDGITGIMIDGVDLHLSTISAADFVFKVGNDNDTANWQDAPTPSQVLVLAGEGVGGSDRIAITWEAGSITDQWLEVTIRKAGHVNVLNDEVFYVGNCIGDANGNGTVGIDDVFAIWNNRLSAASSEMATAGSQYDLDKDGAVDISDVFTAWNHRLDQNNMSKYLAPIQPTQQVQQLNVAQPQVAENRLAMAISSMQGRYELNLVAEQDSDPVDLGAFSLTEFLPDSE
ncbi:MAG: SdrD B-like domain-containing protein, partial [Phycisphaeraceae bacterium JB051]